MAEERKEIIEEKLDEITGGKYSAEAKAWVEKNRKVITNRAKECGIVTAAKLIAMDFKVGYADEVYSLDAVKKMLNDLGIETSDLQ